MKSGKIRNDAISRLINFKGHGRFRFNVGSSYLPIFVAAKQTIKNWESVEREVPAGEEYFITISPEESFAFNQVVPVTINATDIGENPNVMPEFSYEFTCGADNSPPQVILWDPSNNQEVSRIYPLTVQIIDPETGINQNSIEFYLDDVEITMDCNISLISNGYNIQYIPDSAHYHSYGTHQMRIVCSDNSSNLLDDSSSFICVEDTDPPFTENHYPAQFIIN